MKHEKQIIIESKNDALAEASQATDSFSFQRVQWRMNANQEWTRNANLFSVARSIRGRSA